MADSDQPFQPRCMHLRCKSMLVYGEAFEEDPEYQAGLSDFWCNHTSQGIGPDGGEVSMEVCRNPERACYQAY